MGGAAKTKTSLAVVYREGDLYVAECQEVGTSSSIETVEEALKMFTEATEARLEASAAPDNGQSMIMTTITAQKAC